MYVSRTTRDFTCLKNEEFPVGIKLLWDLNFTGKKENKSVVISSANPRSIAVARFFRRYSFENLHVLPVSGRSLILKTGSRNSKDIFNSEGRTPRCLSKTAECPVKCCNFSLRSRNKSPKIYYSLRYTHYKNGNKPNQATSSVLYVPRRI